MKRALSTVLVLCIFAAALAGCGGGSNETAEYDIEELSAKIVDSGAFSDILSQVNDDIVISYYGFDAADVDKMHVYISTGATTEEVGLFKCKDSDAASRVLAKAQERAQAQKTAYQSYAPAEVPKIDDAVIKADGVYVFYIVANDYGPVNSLLK